MIIPLGAWLSFAMSATVLTGCDSGRYKADLSQNKCNDRGPSQHNPLNVARPSNAVKVIRLTNSGEFVDRCEFTDALFELNWDIPRQPGDLLPPRLEGAQSLPKLIVLYIHGWKHNADKDDTDLIRFTALVDRLRTVNAGKSNVAGIYIGWNAEAGLGLLDNLTFWSKKDTADRIAQSNSVTEIVSAIGAMSQSVDNRDQFVAIGHSFGARLLFSATAQTLIYETEKAHPGRFRGKYKIIHGAADAVILINPAFDAGRYTSLDDITRLDEAFQSTQPPLIITVSTDADWATKTAFPIGQWFGGERQEKEMTTLGNFDPFITHHLLPSTSADCSHPDNVGIADEFFAGGLCLKRDALRPVSQKDNPFIVARTNSEVMNGHNDIWNDLFSNWLFDIVAATLHTKISESKGV